jgi:hypothetical protein
VADSAAAVHTATPAAASTVVAVAHPTAVAGVAVLTAAVGAALTAVVVITKFANLAKFGKPASVHTERAFSI